MTRPAIALAVLLLPAGRACAASPATPAWDPWSGRGDAAAARVADPERRREAPAGALRLTTSPVSLAGLLLIRGYQVALSGRTASGCRFRPSCSAYAFACVARHGLVVGTWLAADRLSRCHEFAELGAYAVRDGWFADEPPARGSGPLSPGAPIPEEAGR